MNTITCFDPNMKFTGQETLDTLVCATCSMMFAIPERFDQERRKDHRSFYCPAGHSLSYQHKSNEEKLRDEVAQLQREREFAEARERDLRVNNTQLKLKNAAQRGVTTRIKNRIGAGVCPCCRRNFVSLGEHMRKQHPNYRHTDV